MSWIEKDHSSPFDSRPIIGFFMLDGDMLFTLTRQERYRGVKRPMIAFPSGVERALWPTRNPKYVAEFYLFGEMALPVQASRDEAFEQACAAAARYDYGAMKVGEHELEVWDERDYDHFRVIYDGEAGQVINAVSLQTAWCHLPRRFLDEIPSDEQAPL